MKCDAGCSQLGNNADLAHSIAALSDSISKATQNNSSGLSWESILFALFVAIVGALSAYAFNHLHWKIVTRRQNITGFSNGLSELIKELESLTTEYWMEGYESNRDSQIRLSEVRIKSNMKLLARYVAFLSMKSTCDRFSDKAANLERLNNDLYDQVTGDEFESTNRQSSKPTAQKISGLCSEMRMVLSELNFSV